MNYLHFMWYSYSFIITASGINILCNDSIPSYFRQLFVFGKVHASLKKQKNVINNLEVPKRWFSHFYVFASCYIPFITVSTIFKYFGISSCSFLCGFLDIFASPIRQAQENMLPESVVITGVLLSLHVVRRCYECYFISSFSNSKMNILHYIVGHTFYFGVGLSLIHDAPGFDNCGHSKFYISGQWFLTRHIIGALLFIAAFFLQFEAHKSFAGLRRKGDKVVTLGHYIPSGGGFEYVSCPHYFAEIVMYLSCSLILGLQGYTWWLACLWTVTNQTVTGLMSHQWYLKEFKDYPRQRKAVIPFLL